MRLLVKSCIRKKNGIGLRKKFCVIRPQEERHASNQIKRAVVVKIIAEDSNRCSIIAMRETLKTFN